MIANGALSPDSLERIRLPMTELLAATSRRACAADATERVERAEVTSAAIFALSSIPVAGELDTAASTPLSVLCAPNALSHGMPYVVLTVTLLETGAAVVAVVVKLMSGKKKNMRDATTCCFIARLVVGSALGSLSWRQCGGGHDDGLQARDVLVQSRTEVGREQAACSKINGLAAQGVVEGDEGVHVAGR